MRSQNWLSSVSDIMSALMMIFLFIAISFMLESENARKKEVEKSENLMEQKTELLEESIKLRQIQYEVRKVAYEYSTIKESIYRELRYEFSRDLHVWKAELLPDTNTFRFNQPEILFAPGKADLRQRFKSILDDFFPRYLRVLSNRRFMEDIVEIRIEGHTSSDWSNNTDTDNRYLLNAKLSQERAFSVLEYCFRATKDEGQKDWLISVLRANGASYSDIIKQDNGLEDQEKSRRVEIRVVTKSEEKVTDIISMFDHHEAN
jgi:outer membrane protein OmpA-like peptidoglycan-associated protein